MNRPIIGITCDIDEAGQRHFVRPQYARAIEDAGGVPFMLAPRAALAESYADLCRGILFTGGDDPIMEDWGVPTHPRATKVHRNRQRFERALLGALDRRTDVPVLGICLGMQMMALHVGGAIDQHLPESRPEHAGRHWGRVGHPVEATMPGGLSVAGTVLSHHRQAVVDPGRLRIVGRCPDDGVIEAVADDARGFFLGVQWHPERTLEHELGAAVFTRFIEAARGACALGH